MIRYCFRINEAAPESFIYYSEKRDWCVNEFVGLLKKIHSTRVPQGELPDARDWLLERTDTLLFTRNELEIKAVRESLPHVTDFLESILDETDCPMKARMQIALAVEEVFINIASYAYTLKEGLATVRAEIIKDPHGIKLTFIDSGRPYDPLKKSDPDVTLSAEDREIGGLGIFMVKKLMDDIRYEYQDGKNVLTLIKKF